jgi:hypothetical protein
MRNQTQLVTRLLSLLALSLIVGGLAGCANRPVVEFPISNHHYVDASFGSPVLSR